jgi:hypothetical protein
MYIKSVGSHTAEFMRKICKLHAPTYNLALYCCVSALRQSAGSSEGCATRTRIYNTQTQLKQVYPAKGSAPAASVPQTPNRELRPSHYPNTIPYCIIEYEDACTWCIQYAPSRALCFNIGFISFSQSSILKVANEM